MINPNALNGRRLMPRGLRNSIRLASLALVVALGAGGAPAFGATPSKIFEELSCAGEEKKLERLRTWAAERYPIGSNVQRLLDDFQGLERPRITFIHDAVKRAVSIGYSRRDSLFGLAKSWIYARYDADQRVTWLVANCTTVYP